MKLPFVNDKNPLLSEHYPTIGSILEAFEGKTPQVNLIIESTRIVEPNITDRELREKFEKKLLAIRKREKPPEEERFKKYYEDYFLRTSGKKEPDGEKGPFQETIHPSIERIEVEESVVGTVTDLFVKGYSFFSSFLASQQNPDIKEELLKEHLWKTTLDPNLLNFAGVAPAVLLIDRKTGKVYFPFGIRGAQSSLAGGKLGEPGAGYWEKGASSPENVATREFGEELPTEKTKEGIERHVIIDNICYRGSVYIGKNPHDGHAEIFTLAQGSLKEGWNNYFVKVHNDLYKLNPESLPRIGEHFQEHSNIYLIEVSQKNVDSLEKLFEGIIPGEGKTKGWTEPHLVTSKVGAAYALKHLL